MHGRKKTDPRERWLPAGVSPMAAPQLAGETPALPGHPAFLTAQSDGVTLAIKLQPRASKNEITQASGPELRIKVTAPPVDAAANEALLRLLATTLGCPRGKIALLRGHTARHKVVKVYGFTATAAWSILLKATASPHNVG
jgi:uncharacterized protein (TIGR00251 family)